MTIRSQLARVLTVTVISGLATGAVAPASPAMAMPSTVIATVRVEDPPPNGWAMTTDPASGISVVLPGQPTVKNTTTRTADGADIPLRVYTLELNGGNRVVLFAVGDAAFRSFDRQKGLEGVASAWPDGKVATSRLLDVDGRPSIDGRITATIEGTPAVCLARIVSDSGYLVEILTLGRITDETALTPLHQQVLGTLHLI